MVTRRPKDMLYLSLTPEASAGMGPEKPMRLSIRRAARCIVGGPLQESLPAGIPATAGAPMTEGGGFL